jgi:hypothetical protein
MVEDVAQASQISESDAVELLSSAGFGVTVLTGAALQVTRDGVTEDVELKLRRKTIYEWDARRILETTRGRVLVVVPVASRGLIDAAKRDPRLGVASVADRRLVWNAEEIVAPEIGGSAYAPGEWRGRRYPWGRWALMRVLIRTDEPRSQVRLAAEAGISQPGVSKTIDSIDGVLAAPREGWFAPDRAALWDTFMSEYPGARGITTYWYGLDPISDQARAVVSSAAGGDVRALRSGDVGADEIAPWRVPSRAVVYAQAGIDLAKLGFAQTSKDRATLEYTVPADHTIWATAAAWAGDTDAATADPLIAAWDVKRTGGADADEAADRIRDRVLGRGDS